MAKLTDYLKNIFFILILLQIAPPIIQSIMKQYTDLLEPQTKVACVPVQGVLYDSTTLTKHLKRYFKDNDIKAILLKVDCAGSAAGTGEAIANEIAILKKEYPKPIITLAENICTSGAYYIASTTDYIICAPSTIIGSIGATIQYQFKVDELLKKHDITYLPLAAGTYKNATDPFAATDPQKVKMLQALIDDSYHNFVAHVAKNRPHLSLDASKNWADGKVFSGTQSLSLGLVDEIGSKSNAVAKIKELAVIEGKIQWVKPERMSGLQELVFGSSEESLSTATPGIQQLVVHFLQKFTLQKGVPDVVRL